MNTELAKLSQTGNLAVVVGGSMAGLTVARVLAKHFKRVVNVERDSLPEGPESRRGTPQARHVHVLLLRGRRILGRLFPGFDNQLIASGAADLDAGSDVAWLSRMGWGPNFVSNLPLVACTRDLMDWALRTQLKEMNSVSFLENRDVVGLLPDGSCQRVTGVQMWVRTPSVPAAGETTEVIADLVVDASGRTSQAPRWLEALGYRGPKEVIVSAGHGYSSRFYRMFPDAKRDWKALYVQPAPPEDVRGGLILPVEGDRWLVSLWGGTMDYPPNDEAGFLEFARNLRTPLLYETIRQAEPLTAIASFRSTANRLRQFDRLSRQPENFVVLGDVACTFNPVYGQGMTTAAIEAVLLDKLLAQYRKRGDFTGLAGEFQRRLARANSAPWMLATG